MAFKIGGVAGLLRQLGERVPCPSCGAGIDDPCRTRRGRWTDSPHRKRLARQGIDRTAMEKAIKKGGRTALDAVFND